MFEVKGDSMTGDGALEGDYVVVDRQPEWANGDMVVVLVGDEANVKRIRRDGASICLESSNPEYPPMPLSPSDEPIIQGKVIGVARWHISQGRS